MTHFSQHINCDTLSNRICKAICLNKIFWPPYKHHRTYQTLPPVTLLAMVTAFSRLLVTTPAARLVSLARLITSFTSLNLIIDCTGQISARTNKLSLHRDTSLLPMNSVLIRVMFFGEREHLIHSLVLDAKMCLLYNVLSRNSPSRKEPQYMLHDFCT